MPESAAPAPVSFDRGPVLLCGYPKSGTTLLVSLLDGHDGLLVFPEEMRLFRIVEQLPREEWVDALWSRTGVAQLRRGREETKSGPRDYTAIDYDAYQARVRALWAASDATPRALMEAVAAAYRDALRPEFHGPWMEKTPGNELHLGSAARWWPDVRALQIVRDPRGAFCSYRRKRARSDHPLHLDRFLHDWETYVRAFDAFALGAPGRALRIRYEDLVREPEPTMRRVADFVGVAWSGDLLAPTRAGHEWTGNSMYGTAFTGIDAGSADRWRGEIDADAQRVIEHRLAARMDELGFQREAGSGNFGLSAARVAASSGRGVLGGARMFARLVTARTPRD